MSQSVVSRAERGLLHRVSLEHLERIGQALRVSLFLDARWMDGDADRLIDQAHSAIVDVVVRTLRRLGWTVTVEYGFNVFGERGSVDVLAWHPTFRVLLIVEVKSRLTDLQATFSAFARKVRLVPDVVRRELGWDARHVGRLLVLPGTKGNRALVERHSATFETMFPARMPEVGSWLRRPDRGLGGIWFLSASPQGTRKQAHRVRIR